MGESEITGSVQIEIDGSGLEARLIYTPDEGGEAWNREKINSLFERNHITEGIQTEEIDKLLKSAAKKRSGEAVTVVGARGIPVEEAQDEEVEWDELSVPDDLSENVERVLLAAGEPEIIQTRIEKIKKQQKVEKKGKLGFLPGKEEIVTVVEKKGEEKTKESMDQKKSEENKTEGVKEKNESGK
jgi:hypothetical protein